MSRHYTRSRRSPAVEAAGAAGQVSHAAASASFTEDDMLVALTGDADHIGVLDAGGWLWHHIRRADLAQQMGTPGLPDIVAVHAARRHVLVLELKADKGRYRPGQEAWLAAFAEAGVDARTVRPEDLHALEDEILGDRLIRRTA